MPRPSSPGRLTGIPKEFGYDGRQRWAKSFSYLSSDPLSGAQKTGNGSRFWPLADEEDSDEEIAEAENAASTLSLYVGGAKLQETTVEDHASDRQGIARSPRVVSNPPRASGRESRPLVRTGKRRSSAKISLGDILVNDVCLVREGEERWRLA